jgi:hypothetical protein
MSERRKREDREKTKAFEEEEKGKLRESAWWNTSSGLQTKCPGIEKSSNWEKFLNEYDKRKNQDHRLDEWYEHRTWKGLSPALLELIELAEEATEDNADAAKQLGLDILRIIEGGREFREFVEGVKLRLKRESGVSEAVYALMRFAEREDKLPTRRELNREAYRIKNLKMREIPLKKWLENHSPMDVFEFGHRLGDERIYWMEFERNEGIVRIHTYTEREGARKLLRWPHDSTFTEVLGKAGLRGLV